MGSALCLLLTGAMPFSADAADEANFKFNTTRDLYNLCSVKADAPDVVAAHWACRGFIEATVQYHDGISKKEQLKRLICYPETATISDGTAAFAGWAEKNLSNTEYMNELPVIGVVRALAGKYPCAD